MAGGMSRQQAINQARMKVETGAESAVYAPAQSAGGKAAAPGVQYRLGATTDDAVVEPVEEGSAAETDGLLGMWVQAHDGKYQGPDGLDGNSAAQRLKSTGGYANERNRPEVKRDEKLARSTLSFDSTSGRVFERAVDKKADVRTRKTLVAPSDHESQSGKMWEADADDGQREVWDGTGSGQVSGAGGAGTAAACGQHDRRAVVAWGWRAEAQVQRHRRFSGV